MLPEVQVFMSHADDPDGESSEPEGSVEYVRNNGPQYEAAQGEQLEQYYDANDADGIDDITLRELAQRDTEQWPTVPSPLPKLGGGQVIFQDQLPLDHEARIMQAPAGCDTSTTLNIL